MSDILRKQIRMIEKEEKNFLNKGENEFIKNNLTPIINKIEEKVPDKVYDALNAAFLKGFEIVFQKGTKIIEKTYDKGKIQLEHDFNNYSIDKTLSRKSFKHMDQQVYFSELKNAAISAVEGGALGVLGIGIPDIPVFIGVIMKTIYEIALSYGYDYENKNERYYILLLVCGAITKGKDQLKYNKKIEEYEKNLRDGIELNINLSEQMKDTSKVLADALVAAKFVQGITFVGMVGGVINYTIIRKIGKYSKLKYKKRYLYDKQAELEVKAKS